MSSYSEKLKDPRWQKKRLEVFNRDKFSCKLCRSKFKTIHAHHIEYNDKNNPWDYDISELVTLCEDCHSMLHKMIDRGLYTPMMLRLQIEKLEKSKIIVNEIKIAEKSDDFGLVLRLLKKKQELDREYAA